jgi:insertion element IS1 protein InsB
LRVKKYGQTVELPVSNKPIETVELDEMHTYLREKNYRWIWVAVDRLRKSSIAFVIGDRSVHTGQKLWDNIKNVPIANIASDYWRSYEDFVPPEKHLQTKKETFTVEGFNCRIRHYLRRFHRKTLCYSSEEMMNISLKLLMIKLNKILTILN